MLLIKSCRGTHKSYAELQRLPLETVRSATLQRAKSQRAVACLPLLQQKERYITIAMKKEKS